MQLDATTFILELINFVILVWLLNRFLFKPVLAVMDRRRKQIDTEKDEIDQARKEAEALQEKHNAALKDWEKEKRRLREELEQELSSRRDEGIKAAREAQEREQSRLKAVEEGKREEWRKQTERKALMLGSAFAAKLLERLGGSTLDEKLVDLMLEDVSGWSAEQRMVLKDAASKDGTGITVVSARELSASSRKALEQGLKGLLGKTSEFQYETDKSLISGVRVAVGPWVLQASLGDRLKFFSNGPQP